MFLTSRLQGPCSQCICAGCKHFKHEETALNCSGARECHRHTGSRRNSKNYYS